MDKLRLVLFPECNRNCEGCCNKDWDVTNLPIAESYKDYKVIMLTGGEPMLRPELIKKVCQDIRSENKDCKIILYTAKTEGLIYMIQYLDGLTLTLHSPDDFHKFYVLDNQMSNLRHMDDFSLRVNVFKEAGVIDQRLNCNWRIKPDMEWIDNCPLPDGEVLMRLK